VFPLSNVISALHDKLLYMYFIILEMEFNFMLLFFFFFFNSTRSKWWWIRL